MELILKEGEIGLVQDTKIIGCLYNVFRDNKDLGIAIYLEDDNHGEGFFKITTRNGQNVRTVFVVDEWKIL